MNSIPPRAPHDAKEPSKNNFQGERGAVSPSWLAHKGG
jgi:hypothetical protein